MTVIKAAKVTQGSVSLQTLVNNHANLKQAVARTLDNSADGNSDGSSSNKGADKEKLREVFKEELDALFEQHKDEGFKQGLAEEIHYWRKTPRCSVHVTITSDFESLADEAVPKYLELLRQAEIPKWNAIGRVPLPRSPG